MEEGRDSTNFFFFGQEIPPMEKSKAELKLSALNRGSKGTYHSSTPKNRDIKCFNKKTTTDTRNDGEIKIDDNMDSKN